MAFKCVSGDSTSIPMFCDASSSLAKDAIVCFDVSTSTAVSPVIHATSSLLAEDAAGVTTEAPAAGSDWVNVIPFRAGQIWEYDTTSNTDEAQLGKANDLTDHLTVANSTTISTANTAFVRNISAVGAASNKKMRGLVLGVAGPIAN